MWGSAVYGFFLGMVTPLFTMVAPQPMGSILLWGALACQLTWGATLCWRRTGLPFATGAMAVGAAMSGVVAGLAAAGHVFPYLPIAWWGLVGAGFLAPPLLFLIESRVHRAKWMQWKRYMEPMSAWDILRGRHIPELRNSGT
jgi:hypothetical protein